MADRQWLVFDPILSGAGGVLRSMSVGQTHYQMTDIDISVSASARFELATQMTSTDA
jgi:hypothetical protein